MVQLIEFVVNVQVNTIDIVEQFLIGQTLCDEQFGRVALILLQDGEQQVLRLYQSSLSLTETSFDNGFADHFAGLLVVLQGSSFFCFRNFLSRDFVYRLFLRIVKRGAEYVGVDAKMLENIVHLLVVTMQDSQHQVLCVHLISQHTVGFFATVVEYVVDMLKWILHVLLIKFKCKSTHYFGNKQEFRQLFYFFKTQLMLNYRFFSILCLLFHFIFVPLS